MFYDELNKKAKSDKMSKTHHFRWNLQGKKRTEKWHALFTSQEWKGWKNSTETQNRLNAYDCNLLEKNWPISQTL